MNPKEQRAIDAILKVAGVAGEPYYRHIEIGENGRVKLLELSGCSQLMTLPRQIGQLSKLTQLVLTDCKGMTKLPTHIGQLSELSELKLSCC